MENLERYLEWLQTNNLVENIAVKVGKNNQILYETYRSKSGRLSQSTLFDMASVTKIVVTTSLCLIAIDQGILSIKDPVSKYFPCPPDKQPLTVFNLLTHTMGLRHKNLYLDPRAYHHIPEYILSIPLDFPIGSKFCYSCPGFILLGKVVEKAMGAPLDQLFEKYVAAPLDMTSSCYNPDRSGDIINGNLSADEVGIVSDFNCRFLDGVAGNAGLFSNMQDLTRYVHMLLRHGEPIIQKDTFDLAVKNHTPNFTESRGLGFVYVDEKYPQAHSLFPDGSIGHCGHTGESVFVDLQSGLYVIVLSDATISSVRKYGEEHYNEVIQMRQDIHQAIRLDLEQN